MKGIADESVDIVFIDPPYKYLTQHKWDGKDSFNEETVVAEYWRILKPDGFFIFFGQGLSFAEMSVTASKAGFTYKENIVWNKKMQSSPVHPVARVHELCNIFAKGKAKIRKSRIRFQDEDEPNFEIMESHIDRVMNKIENADTKELQMIREFITERKKEFFVKRAKKHHTTVRERDLNTLPDYIMSAGVLLDGYLEKTIIHAKPDHFDMLHPTQKPVNLLERIMLLCLPSGEGVVLDSFMGSGSCGVACLRSKRSFIGIEKEEKYYDIAVRRINGEIKSGETLF
jgi:site-specific DNA-methyltransferase (adenine-specific)